MRIVYLAGALGAFACGLAAVLQAQNVTFGTPYRPTPPPNYTTMSETQFRPHARTWADATCRGERQPLEGSEPCIDSLQQVFLDAHAYQRRDLGRTPWPTLRLNYVQRIRDACALNQWRFQGNQDNCSRYGQQRIWNLRHDFEILGGCIEVVGISGNRKTYRNRCSDWVSADVTRACSSPYRTASYAMRVPPDKCLSFNHDQATRLTCGSGSTTDSIANQKFTNNISPQPSEVTVATCPGSPQFTSAAPPAPSGGQSGPGGPRPGGSGGGSGSGSGSGNRSTGAPYICMSDRDLNFAGCQGRYGYVCNSGSTARTVTVAYQEMDGPGVTTLRTSVNVPANATIGGGAPQLPGGSNFAPGSFGGTASCRPRGWTIVSVD